MPVRFSAKQSLAAGSGGVGGESPAKRRKGGASDLGPLEVTVCRWGTVDNADVFQEAERGTPVWQLQLVQTGLNNINYKLLDTTRAALPTFEAMGPKADLATLEARHGLRLVSGAPPAGGDKDPDKVGIVQWR
eukprot:3604177-Amphidinium_carterae.1